jgi:hypothetical protein
MNHSDIEKDGSKLNLVYSNHTCPPEETSIGVVHILMDVAS